MLNIPRVVKSLLGVLCLSFRRVVVIVLAHCEHYPMGASYSARTPCKLAFTVCYKFQHGEAS
jgi:hypothetical protein